MRVARPPVEQAEAARAADVDPDGGQGDAIALLGDLDPEAVAGGGIEQRQHRRVGDGVDQGGVVVAAPDRRGHVGQQRLVHEQPEAVVAGPIGRPAVRVADREGDRVRRRGGWQDADEAQGEQQHETRSTYLDQVLLPNTERDVEATGRQVVEMTPHEQVELRQALVAPARLTPAQKKLARIIRGLA